MVQVIQSDDIEHLNLTSLLTEPEMMSSVVPNLHLVATLLSLSHAILDKNKAMAREVVRKLVDELIQRLATPMQSAVTGHHPLPKPEWFYGDEHYLLRHLRFGLGFYALCEYKAVVFDTEVVDLREVVSAPVDLLFGVQLGGGTDIAQALNYCHSAITRPEDTILVLITDLYEGGDAREMRKLMASIALSGVQMVCLPALNDDGATAYDRSHAEYLASLGVPTFACTPDKFPELMASALMRQDLFLWSSQHLSKK